MLPSDVAVSFELTPADYVAAAAAHYQSSAWLQAPIRRAQLALGLLAALAALVVWMGGMGPFGLAWVIAPAAAIGLLPSFARSSQRREIQRVSSRGIANGFFGPHQVRLTDEGIVDSTPAYERLTRWTAVEGVREVNRVLVVYVGPDAFIPIPGSAFLDRDTLEAFRDRFLEKLAAARGDEIAAQSVGNI